MKERPILFSAPMVRALLAGTKTQTRRLFKVPGVVRGTSFAITSPDEGILRFDDGTFHYASTAALSGPYPCPYGIPGDRLWVRETWAYYGGDEYLYQRMPEAVTYRAGGGDAPAFVELDPIPGGRWRSPIHMPRWASRILLEVTDVRAERLQEISEADALAEGVDPAGPVGYIPASDRMGRCRYQYANLWDSVNGAGSWAANPWVWAVSFRRLP